MPYTSKIFVILSCLIGISVTLQSQPFNPQHLSQQSALMHEFMLLKEKKIDSLKNALLTSSDTNAVLTLNELYAATLQINTALAYNYLQQALQKSKESTFARGEAITYWNMAKFYQEQKDLPLSENYYKKALAVFRAHHMMAYYYRAMRDLVFNLNQQLRYNDALKANEQVRNYVLNAQPDYEQIAFCYRGFGIILNALGKYEASFENYMKDIEISRTINDVKGRRVSYFIFSNYYIGNMFEDAGDKTTAVEYFRVSANKALENLMPDVFDEKMAAIHEMAGNYDSALYYLRLREYCVSLFILDTNYFRLLTTELNIPIANIYRETGRYKDAISIYDAALPLCRNYQCLKPDVYLGLSKSYQSMGCNDSSLKYARLLYDEAVVSGSRVLLRNAAEMKWRSYEGSGRLDSAYKYMKIYLTTRDSISADKQLRNISLLGMKHRDDQKTSQINLLTQEKTIRAKQNQILLITLLGLAVGAALLFINISLKRRHDAAVRKHLESEVAIRLFEKDKAQADFEKRTAELEMQSLRAQMNPHFIFNTLNSINSFILKNDRKEASQYLTKFSKLVRLILNNSKLHMISLTDEFDSLKLYIELEQLRFNHHFSYSIIIPEDLDISSIEVPPLVIQPYVENAIWHGLMHKEKPGHLEIEVFEKNASLYCRISDDGVGRKKVKELKQASVNTYKSVGMLITHERIASLSKTSDSDDLVTITDLFNNDGGACGTTVVIKLPFSYDHSHDY